ncbi:unnamed protein product [Didymodactylos carnosus]|uniref:NHL repeat containing protein n=1 Tax=Didymodactylos carnosus TaxID=1234261 RepID=A0A815BEV8_9BILA|nr:unnamed protein product [Didymodactylos carnosus]CAF1270466.1 unnamed protein product [Didymodactylos carnosus]CAF3599337.1 unnamed protein product [Didymodactylos carnosus]CAF4058213.1 unnamed protein product [Didymodactylos carnosus]
MLDALKSRPRHISLRLRKWNTTGITVGNSTQLNSPGQIFIDSNNTLYIVSYGNSLVLKLLHNTINFIVVAGNDTGGSDSNQFNVPQGLYLDQNYNLYVSDFYNNRVQKWLYGALSGTTIAGISGSSGPAMNQFDGPVGLFLDSSNTYMYVADINNHRIMRYFTNSTSGAAGTVVAGGNGAGNSNNQLNQPFSVYYDSASNYLYITNTGGQAVIRWSPGAASAMFVAGTVGVSGQGSTYLSAPTHLTVDPYENLYVSDYSNSRIQMFCTYNSSGITIAGNGTAGSDSTEINGPRGFAFDSQMNLYVSDMNNNRVQKFIKL